MSGFEAVCFVEIALGFIAVILFALYMTCTEERVEYLERKVRRLERRLGRRYK